MVCVGCKRTAKLLLPESSLGNNSAPSMAPCRVVPPPPKVRDAPAVKMRPGRTNPAIHTGAHDARRFLAPPHYRVGEEELYDSLASPSVIFHHLKAPSYPKPRQCTQAPMIMVRSAISLDLPKSI